MNSEIEDLQGRLKITLSELEVKQVLLNKMNTDSKTLTNILCSQKSPFDRSGIGYDHGASTSNAKSKTIFVSSVAYATPHTALSNNVLSSTKKKMCHMLHAHPHVTIVERKDTFVPIARSCKFYLRPSNGGRIFLHPRRLQFGLENLIWLRGLLTLC